MGRIYTFEEHCEAFPELTVERRQAFGVEGAGAHRHLNADGIVGPLTRGGLFVAPTSDHKLIEAALWAARAGAAEHGGNNCGVWVEAFMRNIKIRGNPRWADGLRGGQQGPWCAGFVSWAAMEAYGPQAPRSWSARRITQLWANGGETVALKDVRAGDVICWQRLEEGNPVAGHVGIVAAVQGGLVFVVEGNGARRLGRVGIYAYSIQNGARRGRVQPQDLHMIARRVAG
jgi:cell wall-associated NlpC family hydrolase